MNYIENILGIKVDYQPWSHTEELPYYLLDRYEFMQVTFESVRALFLYPKMELDQLASVKKQIAKNRTDSGSVCFKKYKPKQDAIHAFSPYSIYCS